MKRYMSYLGLGLFVLAPVAFAVSCKAGSGLSGTGGNGGSASTGAGAGSSGTFSSTGTNAPSTGSFATSSASTASGGLMGDPTTCAEAAMYRTYLGCDFYPTVNANNVWSIFDFAAVVANGGMMPATVTVTRGGAPVGSPITVQPNGLGTVYLPWVMDLKGPDADCVGSAVPVTASVNDATGAYHLVSSVPVTVYQFNALEYKPVGGPPGKNWGGCPADSCGVVPCFSYSNDASLLLPSTAMTNNYRVIAYPSWTTANIGATLSITGTQDGTSVTVTLSSTATIQAGGGIPATAGGQKATFTVNAGQVVELIGGVSSDFSGSLVQSTKPVQVITGLPCTDIPVGASACDHIEESVLPAETLGKHYVVTRPTGPGGSAAGAVIRMYGNVNATHLTYPSGAFAGAPAVLNAGQVVDMGVVNNDFEVSGDHEFGVAIFMQGGSVVDPNGNANNMAEGDPSESIAIAVEQYRIKYIFLAPTDYDQNYVDIVSPGGATMTLDGAAVAAAPQAIGSSTFKVSRVHLGAGNNGAHVLTSTVPVGIQVLGYGLYTSYQYPGGLNLDLIAPPPPPPM
jgi:hypothetical protein